MSRLRLSERAEGCLSQYAIDCLVADELVTDVKRGMTAHIESCSRCHQLLMQTSAQKNDFASRTPFEFWRRSAAKEAKDGRSRRLVAWVLAGAPVFVAALVLLVLYMPPVHQPNRMAVRSKGRAYLSFVVDHRGRQRIGRPGDAVHPGDRIQLYYSTLGESYLAVFNRDQTNKLTVLFPQKDRAAKIPGGKEVALPFSSELDDVLGTEIFYGVFCASPQKVLVLKKGLGGRAGQALAPSGCTVDRLILRKRAAPDVR